MPPFLKLSWYHKAILNADIDSVVRCMKEELGILVSKAKSV